MARGERYITFAVCADRVYVDQLHGQEADDVIGCVVAVTVGVGEYRQQRNRSVVDPPLDFIFERARQRAWIAVEIHTDFDQVLRPMALPVASVILRRAAGAICVVAGSIRAIWVEGHRAEVARLD
jgi:hypothetical protein